MCKYTHGKGQLAGCVTCITPNSVLSGYGLELPLPPWVQFKSFIMYRFKDKTSHAYSGPDVPKSVKSANPGFFSHDLAHIARQSSLARKFLPTTYPYIALMFHNVVHTGPTDNWNLLI